MARSKYEPIWEPQKGDPLIKFIFTEINRQQLPLPVLEEMSRVDTSVIARWRITTNPLLFTYQTVLNALGYELCIRNKKSGELVNLDGKEEKEPQPA